MTAIAIQTNDDFTPKGKRAARVITLSRGARQLRWYVGGAIYRRLAISAANIEMTKNWLGA